MAPKHPLIGKSAPVLSLPNAKGASINLGDYYKYPLVLFFYPGDFSPGCTLEVCRFRDQYQVFKEAGAEVVGVSKDSIQSHEEFAAKYQLQYTLLSDQNGEAKKAFAVPSSIWGESRVTFVIDQTGTVRYFFNAMIDFDKHVRASLKALKAMKEGGAFVDEEENEDKKAEE
ncbi:peroxiredoxin [Cladochytrium replicatum]|nr:peroxiredoxin [Cladochytrium replicatum]